MIIGPGNVEVLVVAAGGVNYSASIANTSVSYIVTVEDDQQLTTEN